MVFMGMQEFHNVRQHVCIIGYGEYDVTFQLNPIDIISDWWIKWSKKENLNGFNSVNDSFWKPFFKWLSVLMDVLLNGHRMQAF